jgi:hypothetical protein
VAQFSVFLVSLVFYWRSVNRLRFYHEAELTMTSCYTGLYMHQSAGLFIACMPIYSVQFSSVYLQSMRHVIKVDIFNNSQIINDHAAINDTGKWPDFLSAFHS